MLASSLHTYLEFTYESIVFKTCAYRVGRDEERALEKISSQHELQRGLDVTAWEWKCLEEGGEYAGRGHAAVQEGDDVWGQES